MKGVIRRRAGQPWEWSAPLPLIGLLLLSILSIQFGNALAKSLFDEAGLVGITFLRNLFSTLVLLIVACPDVRAYTRRHWGYAAAVGIVTAGMNLAFYGAAARIPMGIAVAIDFLGPITVAFVNARRPQQVVWPCLAYVGVLLLTPIGTVTSLDPLGVALALCAAIGWGLYIVLTARTSALFGSTTGLTLSTGFGTLALLPVLLAGDADRLWGSSVLLMGFAVAMLSTAIPFSLEFKVLRSVPERVFGVLLSIEPAVAALIALVVLGETLSSWEWLAIGLVVCAAAGAAKGPGRRRGDVDVDDKEEAVRAGTDRL